MVSTAFSLYSAVNKEIIAMKVMSKEEFEKQNVFGTGTFTMQNQAAVRCWFVPQEKVGISKREKRL